MLTTVIEAFAGATAIEIRTGGTTVTVVDPWIVPGIVPEAAVIVVLPTTTPFARPAGLIGAIVAADEVHVAD